MLICLLRYSVKYHHRAGNVSTFGWHLLNMVAKFSQRNEEHISAYVLPLSCFAVIKSFPCAVAAIMGATFFTAPLWIPFPMKSEINSFSRISLYQSSWNSGLVKRVHFIIKTSLIQIEPYTLLPNVCGKFMKNLSLSFKSFLVRIPFLRTLVYLVQPFADLWQLPLCQ